MSQLISMALIILTSYFDIRSISPNIIVDYNTIIIKLEQDCVLTLHCSHTFHHKLLI